MAASHGSKKRVRESWLAEIDYQDQGYGPNDRVLYLTLCGRHAVDIQMLIDAGILLLTENDAIDITSSPRVVAFENNSIAATEIKRKFVGLDVSALDIHSELVIQNPLAFPDNKKRIKFQAAVINLDYDRSAEIAGGQITPVRAVKKVGQIQQAKQEPWSLLLTVNSTINWSPEDQNLEQQFLADELEKCEAALQWLGDQCEDAKGCLTESLSDGTLSVQAVQAFHLLLMTARLSEALSAHGWRLTAHKAFSYGTQPGRAPMVSWIFRLDYFEDAERRRGEFVQYALTTLIAGAESIAYLDDPPN